MQVGGFQVFLDTAAMQVGGFPVFLDSVALIFSVVSIALIFCFCFFAFYANPLNPFVKPRRGSSKYRHVKFIRYVTIALLFSVSLAVLFYKYTSQPLFIAATAGAAFFAIVILLPSIRYYDIKLPFLSKSNKTRLKSRNKSTTQEESATVNQGITTRQEEKRNEKELATIIDRFAAQHEPAITRRPLATERSQVLTSITANAENEVELQQRTPCNVYAMQIKKIAKATASIDYELTHFDPCFAEAEFIDIGTPSSYVSNPSKVIDIELE